MVQLVGSVMELRLVRGGWEAILAEIAADRGVPLTIPIGTMRIKLPRAALTAHRIADAADFFSFGTNDLTQTTWGFSGTTWDAGLRLVWRRVLFTVSPFETIDGDGVGRLVQIAAEEGRKTKPGLDFGVCGKHRRMPESSTSPHRSTGLSFPARRSGCP